MVALSCVIVCSAGPQKVRAAEFIKRSVIFETKVLAHLDKGVPLDPFKVMMMSANPPKLGGEQEARLNMFTANGGVIIRDGKARAGTAARAEAAAAGPRLSLEPPGHVLGQLTRKPTVEP